MQMYHLFSSMLRAINRRSDLFGKPTAEYLQDDDSYRGSQLYSVRVGANPFRLRGQFLNAHEFALLSRLMMAVSPHALVFPKVRVSDVLSIIDATRNMDDALAIDRKRVDFLLCDMETVQPRAAIYIAPECRGERRVIFSKVEKAMRAAKLPVIHIEQPACSIDDLRKTILPFVQSRSDSRDRPRVSHSVAQHSKPAHLRYEASGESSKRDQALTVAPSQ